jgi:hypothetical protein
MRATEVSSKWASQCYRHVTHTENKLHSVLTTCVWPADCMQRATLGYGNTGPPGVRPCNAICVIASLMCGTKLLLCTT